VTAPVSHLRGLPALEENAMTSQEAQTRRPRHATDPRIAGPTGAGTGPVHENAARDAASGDGASGDAASGDAASGDAAGISMWPAAPDSVDGGWLAERTRAFNDRLAADPVLKSIDGLWNANPLHQVIPVDWAEAIRALRSVWFHSLGNPADSLRAAGEFNMTMGRAVLEAWTDAGRRWWGWGLDGARAAPAAPSADKRFAAPEWQFNPAFRIVKEAYLLTGEWLVAQGEARGDLAPAERQRLVFHLRQFVDATSPTLFAPTNPAVWHRAMETGGASLAQGAANLLADMKAGRLSMVDTTAFAPGRNLALTPGKVVYRNRLIELIQYAPTTATAHARPLLIVPPWINKYYILDLQPKNSLVRHFVSQGFTVFIISWKNPDQSMDAIAFEDYMDLGPLAASDVAREITGSPDLNVMGYCIGGTLMSVVLSWLAAKGDRRFNAATFIVSLQDFAHVGDTAVFMTEPAIDYIEQQMMERGYLDSREMSTMFNLLRSNDLIWSNVVNNYLLGKTPPAFDLLYWNNDGTRMARAAHSWYLRNTYVENNLIKPGRVRIKGEAIDLGRIAQDVYAVGAEKDHIVPWDAAWRINTAMSGDIRYVLASSGHIAGIINPPGGKGTYWVNETGGRPASADEWRRGATAHNGSWWNDWAAWLAARSGPKGALPPLGGALHPPLDDAPGRYVLET
jgi:polyhydroxyalkanoate synthase